MDPQDRLNEIVTNVAGKDPKQQLMAISVFEALLDPLRYADNVLLLHNLIAVARHRLDGAYEEADREGAEEIPF